MPPAAHELELIPFRRLLDEILVPARRHFRQLFLPVAVPVAACGVLAAVLQLGWLKALSADDVASALPLLAGFLLAFLVVMAVYGVGFSALMVASLNALGGRPAQMGRAWLWPLSFRVALTLFLTGVLYATSFLMCLVPALYVGPTLSFVVPVMVEEQRFGFAAIRRSFELTHTTATGRWLDSMWPRVLVFFIVGMAITYALGLSVQLPFILAQQLVIFRDAAAGQIVDPASVVSGTFWLQIPAQILGAFATTAAWLYWSFGIGMLYREARKRQEGADLQQAIAELTGEPA